MEPLTATPDNLEQRLDTIEQNQAYLLRHVEQQDLELISRNQARKEVHCGRIVLDDALKSGALASKAMGLTNQGHTIFGILRGDLRRWNLARLSKSQI